MAKREGLDSSRVLADLLERVCGPEDFWEQVKENLGLGRIQLVHYLQQTSLLFHEQPVHLPHHHRFFLIHLPHPATARLARLYRYP